MISTKTISTNWEKSRVTRNITRLVVMLVLMTLLIIISTQKAGIAYAQDGDADIGIYSPGDSYPGKNETIDPVRPGQTFLYRIRVTNAGPDNATNVLLRDWIPAGLSINNATTYQGDVNIGVPGNPLRPLLWSIGLLTDGETAELTYNVTVLESPDPSLETWILHNDVMVTSETYDPDNSNNYYTEDTTVIGYPGADLSLVSGAGFRKYDTSDPVNTGQSFQYKLSVTCDGPGNATGVLVKDWIPAGVRINNASASDGEINMGVPGDPLRPLTWAVGDMPVGRSSALSYNVTVLKPFDLSIKSWIMHNDAMVTSETYDPDNSNNLVTEDTTVINTYFESDLRVIKLSKPDNIAHVDQLVNYTIIIENRGPGTAHDVEFRDELRASGVFDMVEIKSLSGGAYVFSILPPESGRTVSFTGTRTDSTMEHGERDIIQVTVRANKTMDINNLVGVYCEDLDHWVDPDMSNNEDYVPISVEGTSILAAIGGIITPTTLPIIVAGYLIIMSLTFLMRGRIQIFQKKDKNTG